MILDCTEYHLAMRVDYFNKKAVFTSCKNDDQECPPWRLEASEIKHDKNKKQLIYENSILKIYDFPIFYFPKFFHPDPTVKDNLGF